LENHEYGKKSPSIDVIIPIYAERCEALAATLSACLHQTYPISKIFVVDDGSPEPISLPDWAKSYSHICLSRLPRNQGISAAWNAAIARSNARLLACVNTEVLPDPDWLSTCESHLSSHLKSKMPAQRVEELAWPSKTCQESSLTNTHSCFSIAGRSPFAISLKESGIEHLERHSVAKAF
jgi:Glycosyl transferase family 2